MNIVARNLDKENFALSSGYEDIFHSLTINSKMQECLISNSIDPVFNLNGTVQ